MNKIGYTGNQINLFPLQKFLDQFGVYLSPNEINRQTELQLIAADKTVNRLYEGVMRELRAVSGDLPIYDEKGYIEGVKEEILFWWQFAAKSARRSFCAERFDFADFFPETNHVEALNIGAAIFSEIGIESNTHTVEVTCVDPLAYAYKKILGMLGVDMNYRLVTGEAETLLNVFGAKSYDLVYVKNALDHARDPHRAFENILGILRQGGVAQLIHFRNEAVNQGYSGMHQWNIDYNESEGQFVFWNKTQRKILVPDPSVFKTTVNITQVRKNPSLSKLYDQVEVIFTKL